MPRDAAILLQRNPWLPSNWERCAVLRGARRAPRGPGPPPRGVARPAAAPPPVAGTLLARAGMIHAVAVTWPITVARLSAPCLWPCHEDRTRTAPGQHGDVHGDGRQIRPLRPSAFLMARRSNLCKTGGRTCPTHTPPGDERTHGAECTRESVSRASRQWWS